MHLAQFGNRKAELCDSAGLEILHEHVGLGDEPVDDPVIACPDEPLPVM